MAVQSSNRWEQVRFNYLRRREFVAGLGGAAVWPFAARAQPTDRMRGIGVLLSLAADDPESPARITAFREGLQQSGWTDGRNARIDTRSDKARLKSRGQTFHHLAEVIWNIEKVLRVNGRNTRTSPMS